MSRNKQKSTGCATKRMYDRNTWANAPEKLKKVGRLQYGGEVYYEIEDILERKTYSNNATLYFVKWANWPSTLYLKLRPHTELLSVCMTIHSLGPLSYNSWEKAENLANCDELTDKFNLEVTRTLRRPISTALELPCSTASQSTSSSSSLSSPIEMEDSRDGVELPCSMASQSTSSSVVPSTPIEIEGSKDAVELLAPVGSDIPSPLSTGPEITTHATRITCPSLITRLRNWMMPRKGANPSVVEFVRSDDEEHSNLVRDVLLNEPVRSIGNYTPTKIFGFKTVDNTLCVRLRWENGLVELVNYEAAKIKFGALMDDLVKKFNQ